MTSDSHAILTSEQAALLAALLQPLERADRAIGREPGPFRFETNSGYRDLSREDLSNAAQVYRTLQSAALASTAGAGAGDWQPLSLLAPQTNAMLGRWCRCGDREDGSEHWYWQQAFGRYFDFQGERHWCLDGHQFEAGPFYGEAPTHFFAVASAPSRQSPAVPASPISTGEEKDQSASPSGSDYSAQPEPARGLGPAGEYSSRGTLLEEILSPSQRQDLSERLHSAYLAPHGGLHLLNAEVAYLWTKIGGQL